MNAVSRPVMCYHGGKFGPNGMNADKIIGHFPDHRIYVEPFGGAASVLMRKPRSYGEIYNDRWEGVVSVFRVLRDPIKAARLRELLHLTPFARDELDLTCAKELEGLDEIEHARRLIFRSFSGFGSDASNPYIAAGFRSSCKRSGNTPARDWANFPELVDAFTERLRGVVIENLPAEDVMPRHDTVDTLYFVDPPYVHAARGRGTGSAPKHRYPHEMSNRDHFMLAAQLKSLKGMVIISGYHTPLYDEIYHAWECVEFGAYADGAGKRTEVLWFNPMAWERRPVSAARAP